MLDTLLNFNFLYSNIVFMFTIFMVCALLCVMKMKLYFLPSNDWEVLFNTLSQDLHNIFCSFDHMDIVKQFFFKMSYGSQSVYMYNFAEAHPVSAMGDYILYLADLLCLGIFSVFMYGLIIWLIKKQSLLYMIKFVFCSSFLLTAYSYWTSIAVMLVTIPLNSYAYNVVFMIFLQLLYMVNTNIFFFMNMLYKTGDWHNTWLDKCFMFNFFLHMFFLFSSYFIALFNFSIFFLVISTTVIFYSVYKFFKRMEKLKEN